MGLKLNQIVLLRRGTHLVSLVADVHNFPFIHIFTLISFLVILLTFLPCRKHTREGEVTTADKKGTYPNFDIRRNITAKFSRVLDCINMLSQKNQSLSFLMALTTSKVGFKMKSTTPKKKKEAKVQK